MSLKYEPSSEPLLCAVSGLDGVSAPGAVAGPRGGGGHREELGGERRAGAGMLVPHENGGKPWTRGGKERRGAGRARREGEGGGGATQQRRKLALTLEILAENAACYGHRVRLAGQVPLPSDIYIIYIYIY